jgi:hypothetical protein
MLKAIIYSLLVAWGITTIICLCIYSQKEMEMNTTIYTDKNETYATGKELVAQNALVVCRTFIAIPMLYLMYRPNLETEL